LWWIPFDALRQWSFPFPGSPAVDASIFTRLAQTLAIVLAKVVVAVGHSDFLADVNVPSSHDFHTSLARSLQLRIGIAIVIRKASWAHK
jgi:hypothetical protein